MRRPLTFFIVFSTIATVAMFILAYGQAQADRRRERETLALLHARAVAIVAADELTREAEQETPPGEEPPPPGQATQAFLSKLPMGQALVLVGTKFYAHHEPAKVGTRLSQDSALDKILYDSSQALRANLKKNAEEREANPAVTRDAYASVFVKDEGGTLTVTVPVVGDDGLRGIAQLTTNTPARPASAPLDLLGALVGAIVAFGLATVALRERADSTAGLAIGAALLGGLLFIEAQGIAARRAKLEESALTDQAAAIGALGRAGFLNPPRTALDPAPSLALDADGSRRPELKSVLSAVQTASVGLPRGVGLWIPEVSPEPGSARTIYDQGAIDARAATHRQQAVRWAGVVGILAALGFFLGSLGQLGRAAGSFWSHRTAYGYMSPASIGMAVLVFVPVAYGIVLGFYKREYNVFNFVGFSNFLEILSGGEFYTKLGVTVMWTGINVVLHVSIGLFLALLLNDTMLKAKGIYRVILIIPWAIPNYITALIWKGMFHKQFGAVNFFLEGMGMEPVAWFQSFWPAFTANVVTNTWLGFPFMMVISLGALQSIPGDLYEAAWVDGASRWQRFRNITLPLLMPALVPSVILGTVWTFNMFNIIYLVSGGAPNGATDILITDAFRWAFERNQYGYAAAYSTLIFLILLAFSVTTNKITGTTKGAFE